jgi:hypothetical protein
MPDTPSERAGGASPASRPYLNTRQAAHHLCMSVRKLEALRGQGKGPRFRRHGRLVFYHIDDLEAWSRTTGGGEGADGAQNAGARRGEGGGD